MLLLFRIILVYGGIRMVSVYSKKIIRKIMEAALIIVAIGYVYALLKIVLFKYGLTTGERSLNLQPFDWNNMLSGGTTLDVSLKNILGNIAIFIPLGIYTSLLLKKNIWISVLIGFSVSLLFEIIQFASGCGAADIDDVILNSLGTIIGVLLYTYALSKLDKKCRLPIATLTFLIVFGLCGRMSLYLYAPNMLPPEIETVNEEILKGLDVDDFDIDTMAFRVKDNLVETTTDTSMIRTSQRKEIVLSNDGVYRFAKSIRFIEKKMGYQYSPNGNIQKTTISYAELSKDELKNILDSTEDGDFISIYLDEKGECEAIIITVW